MADKWISDKRQRRSKRYEDIHRQLKAECQPFHKSYTVSPSEKTERKRAKSQDFRAHGDAS